MTEVSTKPLFGGKAYKALEWEPLPYMEEYLENLAVDGTTEGYIRPARVGLAHFARFLRNEGIEHPDEIERRHILRFQAFVATLTNERTGEPLKISYRQQLLRYVGTWIHWLLECEHIDQDPWIRIKIGRTPKKPKPLEDEEISALFDAHKRQAFTIKPFFFHRRETLLVVLFGWGLRIHEASALTVTGMDMRLDYVVSINKGGGSKTLPYADEMKFVVQRYLGQRAHHAVTGGDALLIDQQGNPLSTAMIYKIVTELGARAGVMINPHRLRDTAATKMLDGDMAPERVQQILGHATLARTLTYARVNDHKVKEAHDGVMNPLLRTLLGREDVPQ